MNRQEQKRSLNVFLLETIIHIDLCLLMSFLSNHWVFLLEAWFAINVFYCFHSHLSLNVIKGVNLVVEANKILLPFNFISTVVTFHFSCLLWPFLHESGLSLIKTIAIRKRYASQCLDKLNFRLKSFPLHSSSRRYHIAIYLINLIYGYFWFSSVLVNGINICNDLVFFYVPSCSSNEWKMLAGRYLMWLFFFMHVFVLTNYNYLGSGVTINEVNRKVVPFSSLHWKHL